MPFGFLLYNFCVVFFYLLLIESFNKYFEIKRFCTGWNNYLKTLFVHLRFSENKLNKYMIA